MIRIVASINRDLQSVECTSHPTCKAQASLSSTATFFVSLSRFRLTEHWNRFPLLLYEFFLFECSTLGEEEGQRSCHDSQNMAYTAQKTSPRRKSDQNPSEAWSDVVWPLSTRRRSIWHKGEG